MNETAAHGRTVNRLLLAIAVLLSACDGARPDDTEAEFSGAREQGTSASEAPAPPAGSVAETATPLPSPSALPTLEVLPPDRADDTCENTDVGYVVSYPASWYVHPPTSEYEVSECQLFGRAEFAVRDPYLPQEEASVAIFDLGGPCLEYDLIWRVDDWARYAIDGYPAVRIDAVAGGVRDRSYVVNLRPDVAPVMVEPRVMWQEGDPDTDCEGGLGLWLLTRDGMAGDSEENRAALDRMAATLKIGDR